MLPSWSAEERQLSEYRVLRWMGDQAREFGPLTVAATGETPVSGTKVILYGRNGEDKKDRDGEQKH